MSPLFMLEEERFLANGLVFSVEKKIGGGNKDLAIHKRDRKKENSHLERKREG